MTELGKRKTDALLTLRGLLEQQRYLNGESIAAIGAAIEAVEKDLNGGVFTDWGKCSLSGKPVEQDEQASRAL